MVLMVLIIHVCVYLSLRLNLGGGRKHTLCTQYTLSGACHPVTVSTTIMLLVLTLTLTLTLVLMLMLTAD